MAHRIISKQPNQNEQVNIERIIITLEENGAFKGASSQDFGGQPVPIAEADLGTLGDKIHAPLLAALETLTANIAELTDFKSRAEQGIQQVVAVVNDPNIGEEETAATVNGIIHIGMAPERERKDAEIDKQIAALLASKS